MTDFKYNPALDGIRGIALLLVILFHFGSMSGGWIGVEIFFVLSGYLISSILLGSKERRLGGYLYRFYGRRILRIFPPYFLYLALTGASFLIFGEPREMAEAAVGLFTFTYNITWQSQSIRPTDFFIHFWSLCVEEQFYLVWPFFIYFCPRKLLKPVLISLICISPLIRFILGSYLTGDPLVVGRTLYFLPFAHLDALAAGALLASLNIESQDTERLIRVFSLAAGVVLALHLIAVCLVGGAWQHAFDFGLPETMREGGLHIFGISVVVIGAAGLLLCAVKRGRGRAVLSHQILVRFGKVSYVGYILHLPVIYLMSKAWPVQVGSPLRLVLLALVLGIIFALAEASFRFFESPILALKAKFS